MSDPDLAHFVEAQASVYHRVVAELTAGRKQSHWMWFIFPQLAGLGSSAMSQRFAIRDLDHARSYLDDPVLGRRLVECVWLMLAHHDRSALEILGSPDDKKLRSCLTLFGEAAPREADKSLFAEALGRFYDGQGDPRTLAALGGG